MSYIIELRNIRKEFPGVVALDDVSFYISPGCVHALVGENGAGKSTLMKILSGSYTHFEGEIIYEGKSIQLQNEKDALKRGISIVHQELNPIPELSIAENIFLGREPQKIKGIINAKELKKKTKDLLNQLGLDYDPETKVGELSIAQKQMIEIIKAISRNCKVILMDEPTSALTDIEVAYLFKQIKSLKKKEIAIIFISHKLNEVFEICDEVTVLRDGKFIGHSEIPDVTKDELITMMVGREVKDIYPPLPKHGEEVILSVKNLTAEGSFKNISFNLKRGEILGFAGMMGAGRSEIMRCIFGLDRYDEGEIILDGKKLKTRRVRDVIKAGIAMITEDRATYGFVGIQSILHNIALPNLDMFSKNTIIQKVKLQKESEIICKKLSVKAPDTLTQVGTLSGGNQQKVVLSKWLVRNVKVLIMDEPTRGIDVGAKQEIYKLIAHFAEQGMAVILISSEMPEVLAMSHRIVVMSDGEAIGELERDEASQDKIMKIIVEGKEKNEKK